MIKRFRPLLRLAYLFPVIFYLAGCRPGKEKGALHFTLISSSVSGIDFSNTIRENDTVNLISNEYAYNGAGVGVGDFNRDGLQDLFFAGNEGGCKLYLNQGNFHFKDITRQAGIDTHAWVTGVSIVDINNDGYPDIYLCVAGNIPGRPRRNLLYINNGNLTFTEEAAAYGLADTGYSTQAVFFDYDHDGRLDMYLLRHRLNAPGSPNDIRDAGDIRDNPASDKLYKNMGIPKDSTHPVFRDVSREAGIADAGYGLGVVVSDFNGDGWPDLYVGNDYLANDILYLNNRNGTFTNIIAGSLRHQSYSTMGTDAADINNDGLPDLVTLDMQPEDNIRKKMMYSFLSYNRYELERRAGYQPEFMRNMLQLNLGNRRMHDTLEPYFSEIGQLAGIFQTDWSWSVLMADFDNDEWKDVFITNGMGRDLINRDFIDFRSAIPFSPSGSQEERDRMLMQKLASFGMIRLNNYLFKNDHHLRFTDITQSSGMTVPSISNGAVYADLDNDGDLDLITNNINDQAFIYRNDLISAKAGRGDSARHFLRIRLHGDSLNREGIGATLYVYTGKVKQMNAEWPVRGYLSSVDPVIHFGLANFKSADSLKVVWPDGKQQVLENIRADQTLNLFYRDANETSNLQVQDTVKLFTDITDTRGVDYTHRETFFNDYEFQPLLPHQYSQLGPFITTGDVNGDGLADFFVGGAFKYSGKLFTQQKTGNFTGKDLVKGVKYEEDMGALFFNANGDAYPDLVIASGSDEFPNNSRYYRPRLFLNDGRGGLLPDSSAFADSIRTSASVVCAADFDGDGLPDLFIGGRVDLANYPMPPRNYLLKNTGGKFVDVTTQVCPALEHIGMVTAAIWTDFNGDHRPDLIVTGEFMPVYFFENENGKLVDVTGQTGLTNMNGWWRSIAACDVNGDGRTDYIVGNTGMNNPYGITPRTPVKLFASDFYHNGNIDPVLCYYIKGADGQKQLYPEAYRGMLAMQMPFIKQRFNDNLSYAKASLEDILPAAELKTAYTLTCNNSQSGVLINKGNGKFEFHPLPVEAQFAPVNAILCDDFDGDGKTDLLIAGNDYHMAVMTGRYDASYGLFLRGDGKGNFIPVDPSQSGFITDGQVTDMKTIRTATGEQLILVAVNNDKMRLFRVKKK